MKATFIYWFAYYNLDSPSVRYRGKYPLDHLRSKHGIDHFFITPGYRPSKIFRFLIAYCLALFFRKKDSIIVVQRINSNWLYANLLKLLIRTRNERTLYDIDDADYLEYPDKTIRYFMKRSSAVAVGSSELVNYVSKLNKQVLLNTSSTMDLNIVKKRREEVFTVGWIGGFGGDHKESLSKIFFPSLVNIPFKVKLVLIGIPSQEELQYVQEYFKDNVNVILEIPMNMNWQDETAIQHYIVKLDVGIATLLDNEMQRSKSAFKLKQYMNNGVPVLSSDIPENNNFLEDGANGFLCRSADDFRKRIIELRNMSDEEYARLSESARNSIAGFNLDLYCDNLIEFMKR